MGDGALLLQPAKMLNIRTKIKITEIIFFIFSHPFRLSILLMQKMDNSLHDIKKHPPAMWVDVFSAHFFSHLLSVLAGGEGGASGVSAGAGVSVTSGTDVGAVAQALSSRSKMSVTLINVFFIVILLSGARFAAKL